jgi:hypothetical protein
MRLQDYGWALLLVIAVVGALATAGVAVLQAQSSPYGLPVTHTVTLTAVAVDASDYQATSPCEAITWATSDANRATIVPMADAPLSATLTPLLPGSVTITATCGTLTQTVAVQVVGPPVALRIGIGDPKVKVPVSMP